MARQSAAVESSKVVKYIGTADVRKISAADWRSIDVEDQMQVVWDKSNKFQVPVSELTEAAVKYLDENDSGFVVADVSVE
jgi:hypothetical protein